MLKELKWNSVIIAVLYMVLGIILILYPGTVAKTLCILIGWFLVIGGIVTMITYAAKDISTIFSRNDFAFGLIAIILGLVALVKADQLAALIPVLFGIVVTISGFMKLQSAVNLKRAGATNQNLLLILALINILFGCLLIFMPFSQAILMTCIGVGLIYSGITDLIVTIRLSTKYKEFTKQ